MRDAKDGGSDDGDTQGARATEIELKLIGDTRALRRLHGGPLVQGRALAQAQAQRLETTYYDTEDMRLRGRGLALRVRKAGRKYLQSVKGEDAGAAALARRGEWEWPLSSPTPDLALIDAPGLRKRMKLKADDAVHPLFTTRVRRARCVVEHAAADGSTGRIEVALDRGEILFDASAVPIAELELELLQGSPAAVYDLALALHAAEPLAVETRSKSLRGYALALNEMPSWHRAPPLALAADVITDDGMGAIFRACHDHWTANHAAALAGDDPEGVHQMRVTLRRLRSALAVFRALIPVEQFGWLKAETRWLTQALGPARDADVFLDELLAPVLAARPEDPALAALAACAAAARTEGYATAHAAMAEPRYTAFLLGLGRWIEARGWRVGRVMENAPSGQAPLASLADRLLAKRHQAARKRGKGFKRLDAPARHELRIAIKKLRYTAEFFAGLYDGVAAASFIAAAKALQDDLGHLNDVAVAEARLDELRDGGGAEEAHAAGIVLGWHAHGARRAEMALRPRWRAFIKAEPFWHQPTD
ncbi:MAG: CYTH and CHAD domain-containing protein [Alphaproteobacteria bacterium]|nr:CYTH and CHAD domain-containing protein [Alphaproteobacteria bacterium]